MQDFTVLFEGVADCMLACTNAYKYVSFQKQQKQKAMNKAYWYLEHRRWGVIIR